MEHNLLPGEKILDSPVTGLMISTHRVRMETQTSGRAQITSIMLDQLCSCETRYVSRPVLLVIAGISALLGLIMQNFLRSQPGFMFLLVIAVVLVLIYFNTRYEAVSLASAKGEINVKISVSDVQTVRHLIDQVEAAKNARYFRLQAVAAPPVQEPAGNQNSEDAPVPEAPQPATVFHCSKCGVALTEGEVYRHRSGVYCEKHYEKAIAG
ncbi:hypothetical protein HUU05_00800 [candidate division KSB1 bacterium]|nr:hypothetical protein [candidate division KSB1 bacterium]